LGGNASLNDIVSDLDLPAEDEATGIDIAWESDRLDLVDAWGRVNLIEGTAGEEVTLTANLRKGEVWDKVSFRVILGSPGAGYDYARGLEDSLTAVTERVSASAEGEALSFPSVTDSGIRLAWRAPGNYGYPALALVLIAIGFAVYRGRYARVDETVRRWREGIRRDFPGFLNKLLLLLNAGLVLTSAVERIADDYADHRREGEERCFYEELCGMKNRMRASNTTLAMEFADMATRSGQREVLRFSTILADNIDRGSALADKLAQESEMLWRIRTKDAEEKGRLAETKLTFPMALQLLVIILITVAPAVMDMR
jgi:pilus assembly protein TadC